MCFLTSIPSLGSVAAIEAIVLHTPSLSLIAIAQNSENPLTIFNTQKNFKKIVNNELFYINLLRGK